MATLAPYLHRLLLRAGTLAVRPLALLIGANLSLVDNGDGTATLSVSGVPLTVAEQDGSPSVSGVTSITVSNGSLTNNGSGSVTIATGAGGGGGGSFVGARVALGTPMTVTSGVAAAAVAWGSAIFDSDALWGGGNPTRLTIPAGKTGHWQIIGQVNWAQFSAARAVYGELHVNGAYSQELFDVGNAGTIDGPCTQFSTVVAVTAADYIELALAQDTGGDLSVSSGDDSTSMIAVFLGL